MFAVPDPINLDEPEHELCHGPLPPVPDWSGLIDAPENGRGSWRFPCAGLSLMLHAGLVVLALSMALARPMPRPAVRISLLPPINAPGGNVARPAVVPARIASTAPVPPVPATPTAPRPAVRSALAPEKRSAPKSARRVNRSGPVRIAPRETPTPARSTPITPAPSTPDVFATPSPGIASQGRNPVGDGSVASVPPRVSDHGSSGGSRPGEIGTGPVQANFGEADGPRFVRRVLPEYPALARRKGREGRVVLRVTIGSEGELKDVRVVEGGGHGFADAALAAVRASSYAPARRNGHCVECSALLPIRFSLKS